MDMRNGSRHPQGCARQGNNQERHEKREAGRGLDPAYVESAFVLRRVFRHVNDGTAVFAAEGQALDQPCHDEKNGSQDADGGIGRQQADGKSCQAHQRDSNNERLFASGPIAHATEQKSPEGPDNKTGSEGKQREDKRRRLVYARKELS